MHAAYSADLASTPFAAQAVIADAISGYKTRLDMSLAHANCLAMLVHTKDPNAQVFLQSCLIALRRKLSFGAFSEPAPEPTTAIDAVPASPSCEQAGACSL